MEKLSKSFLILHEKYKKNVLCAILIRKFWLRRWWLCRWLIIKLMSTESSFLEVLLNLTILKVKTFFLNSKHPETFRILISLFTRPRIVKAFSYTRVTTFPLSQHFSFSGMEAFWLSRHKISLNNINPRVSCSPFTISPTLPHTLSSMHAPDKEEKLFIAQMETEVWNWSLFRCLATISIEFYSSFMFLSIQWSSSRVV